jgi:hypothetical protein
VRSGEATCLVISKKGVHHAPRTPNGLPFSCRKRAGAAFKKRTILRAQRSAATAGWAAWPLTLTCSRHDRTTPARNHACTTGAQWNHPKHAITLGTTSVRLEPPAADDHARHHGQSAPPACVSRQHNEQSAPRAIEPRLHDGHRHDEPGTPGVRIRDPRMCPKRNERPRCPSRPTLCRLAAPHH